MESDYSNEKVKIERLFFYNGRSFMKKLELFRDFEELNGEFDRIHSIRRGITKFRSIAVLC